MVFEAAKARHKERQRAYTARRAEIIRDGKYTVPTARELAIYLSMGISPRTVFDFAVRDAVGPEPTFPGSFFKNPRIARIIDSLKDLPSFLDIFGGIQTGFIVGSKASRSKRSHRQ